VKRVQRVRNSNQSNSIRINTQQMRLEVKKMIVIVDDKIDQIWSPRAFLEIELRQFEPQHIIDIAKA